MPYLQEIVRRHLGSLPPPRSLARQGVISFFNGQTGIKHLRRNRPAEAKIHPLIVLLPPIHSPQANITFILSNELITINKILGHFSCAPAGFDFYAPVGGGCCGYTFLLPFSLGRPSCGRLTPETIPPSSPYSFFPSPRPFCSPSYPSWSCFSYRWKSFRSCRSKSTKDTLILFS